MVKTLSERFADLSTSLKFEDLPQDVVHEVKRRVLDSIGCAMGSWRDEPCAVARKVASTISAKPGTTLWGTKHIASPDWAAFNNGLGVRYLDYNDTYLSKEPAHPSDNIPASIAVAEAFGATGRELIAAIVLAYEVQCRLCDAISIRAIGWDHVTYGCFSVALAASRLMGLDKVKTGHALGIAGVTSAALRQSRVGELSHWKGAAFANAARHGVYAAMLAANGMTGPAPIFEGEKGFEKLVTRAPLVLKGPIVGDEDRGWMITRTSIKCWPVEYHAQSAVQAALELRQEIGGDYRKIESVLIDSHDAAVQIIGSEPEKWRPKSRETADHSLPYITAVALVDGDVTMESFSEGRIADADLIDFVQRVTVRRHDEISMMYPEAVSNMITLTLKDGRKVTKRVDYPKGNAKNKMTDAEVSAKFHALSDPLIGKENAHKIEQWVSKLEAARRVNDLLPLLVVPGT
jgi:2-methylcitrate dehydratase